MKRQFLAVALMAAFGTLAMYGQGRGQGQAPAPAPSTADPYANNPDAGRLQFPLAAPAGKDSGAIVNAPSGAVNQGALDPAKWKYGPNYNPPPNSKIWNP